MTNINLYYRCNGNGHARGVELKSLLLKMCQILIIVSATIKGVE